MHENTTKKSGAGKTGCYRFISGFFVLMALAAFTGGIYLVAKNYDLKYNGIEVTGVLVGYETSESQQTDRDQPNYGDVDYYHAGIFKYPVNGDTIISRTVSASQDAELAEGDEALIVYSPSDPSYMDMKEKITGNIVAGFVSFILGVIVFLVMLFLRNHFKKQKSQVTGIE